MGPYSMPDSIDHCVSPDGRPTILREFEDMIRSDGRLSQSQAADHVQSTSNAHTPTTPDAPQTPATPITPGTPHTPTSFLGPPITPTNPGPYRTRMPSLTESDSQSSVLTQSDSASDQQSDSASVCSGSDWANFDISPLVKEELKQAIVSRRKTHGLPDVRIDFEPKPPSQLTPEEETRREQQKERNRSAAAKCRSKKRHAVERLVEEAQELETANTQLRSEMKSLEAERTKLQFLLDMHSPNCLKQSAMTTSLDVEASDAKRTRLSTSTKDVASDTIARTSTASTASSSGYASVSHVSPTPSTTWSQSSTEPSTPALLTPTSLNDAPIFPQPCTSMTSMDIPTLDASDDVASCMASSISVDTTDVTTDVFQAVFPPLVPPTPEMDDDEDPLSSSFVKQYLGDGDIGPGDLSFPVADCHDIHIPNQTSGTPQIDEPIQGRSLGESTGVSTDLSRGFGGEISNEPEEAPLTLSFSALLGVSSPEDWVIIENSDVPSPGTSAIDLELFDSRPFASESFTAEGATYEAPVQSEQIGCHGNLVSNSHHKAGNDINPPTSS
ncbi:uncharacterized protein [Diadema antillarum]|uniref:uncharacterized protein n=1 Tax=Diadema antillarum TaxID=105358 RepID=UPI003A88134E